MTIGPSWAFVSIFRTIDSKILMFRVFGYGLHFQYPHPSNCFRRRLGLHGCLHLGKVGVRWLRSGS